MDITISEWRNPTDTDFTSEAYVPLSAQFEDFLGRGGRFGSLHLSKSGATTHLRSSQRNGESVKTDRRKAIVMEEFPNTFMSSTQALRSFRSSTLEYLTANRPLNNPFPRQHVEAQNMIRPLIMIITETSIDSNHSARDSFTAHRLLGPDILHHLGTSVIEFNPMAPTLLTKALEMVIQKEARDSGRRRVPGLTVLQRLGEIGDVRSAIGSLEFLCLRAGDNDDWGGRVASKSRRAASSALTDMERAALDLISQREATLGLFHAVGKVVYNKREDPSFANRPSQPPDHLPQHTRLKVPDVSADTLIDETGTDPRTFIAALQENYVMSCEGHSFTDSFNNCMEALSDSDILIAERVGRFGSARDTYQNMATDALRQDEIAFQSAVRGLLFALPYPVKRVAHPSRGSKKGDAHKLFYPTSMRLSRQMEEMEDLVKRWGFQCKAKQSFRDSGVKEDLDRPNHSTQGELILERLPYIAKIRFNRDPTLDDPEVLKIARFNGTYRSTDEDLEDDELALDALNDKALMPPPAKPYRGAQAAQKETSRLNQDIERLYLSEDDIEED